MYKTGNLYQDDPEYQAWIDSLVKKCSCCPDCNQEIPCGGLAQGAGCDCMCNCDEIDDDEEHQLDQLYGLDGW